MSVLTTQYHRELITSFIAALDDTARPTYAWVGRPVPWVDDQNPPEMTNSISDTEQSIYFDLAYGKLVTGADCLPVVPKQYWANGVVFTSYDQEDPILMEEMFYTINASDDVFKCIYNGGGVPSTVQPNLRDPTGVFQTSDGYVWKYLFTVNPHDAEKHFHPAWLPIRANDAVVANAVGGTIDYCRVDNGGIDYRVQNEGILADFVNAFSVEIQQTASAIDNLYVGSSIYLYAGPGANQIRQISGYNGLNRIVTVAEAFDAFIIIGVSNTAGVTTIGDTFRQKMDTIEILNMTGFVNDGDTLEQTDTGIDLRVVSSNSTVVTATREGNTSLTLDLPIWNSTYGPVQKTGTGTITNGANTVIGSGTNFGDDFELGSFIRVGANTSANIRRVIAVANDTHLTCDRAFSANVVAGNVYLIESAFVPTSVGTFSIEGDVTAVNLTGVELSYANVQFVGVEFILGERVDCTDVSGTSAGGNGTISFANTTVLVLADVVGGFAQNLFVTGQSSGARVQITSVDSTPTITIESDLRRVVTGVRYDILNSVGSTVANGEVASSHPIPNSLTSYIISPTVTITGDGEGAIAYSRVTTGVTSINSIASVNMINVGSGYTRATAVITSNTLFGNGASITPIIGPVDGHGSDPVAELGATRVSVSTFFETLSEELHRFPIGSFRRIGLLRDPAFRDLTVTVTDYDRLRFGLANSSGNLAVGEVFFQANTAAAGVVVWANTTMVEIMNVSGTFTANTANDNFIGLVSGVTGNVKTINLMSFAITEDTQPVVQESTGSSAFLEEIVSNTELRISTVHGLIETSGDLVEPETNTHVTVTGIAVAGISVGNTYMTRFNQTARIPLTTNTAPFTLYEEIEQESSMAKATVVLTTDRDIEYSSANGTFSVGDVVTNSGDPSANALVFAANSTYLRLINVTGVWTAGEDIINNLDVGATIEQSYPCLVVVNVSGAFSNGDIDIVGQDSGARGRNQIGTIIHPDLVRNTGHVLYAENLEPFDRTTTSREAMRLIVTL